MARSRFVRVGEFPVDAVEAALEASDNADAVALVEDGYLDDLLDCVEAFTVAEESGEEDALVEAADAYRNCGLLASEEEDPDEEEVEENLAYLVQDTLDELGEDELGDRVGEWLVDVDDFVYSNDTLFDILHPEDEFGELEEEED